MADIRPRRLKGWAAALLLQLFLPTAPAFAQAPGDCGTIMWNCTNNEEIYSFHVGGMFYGLGNGSVQFIEDAIDRDLWVSLFTRDGEDIVQY